MDEDAGVPAPEAPVEERLLFLQENMVNFVNQFNMPVIEVALVLSKYIRILLESLQKTAQSNDEVLPSSRGTSKHRTRYLGSTHSL